MVLGSPAFAATGLSGVLPGCFGELLRRGHQHVGEFDHVVDWRCCNDIEGASPVSVMNLRAAGWNIAFLGANPACRPARLLAQTEAACGKAYQAARTDDV